MHGLKQSGSGHKPVMGPCEHSNEYLGSKKGKEFLDQLGDYYLFRKDSPPS
jgi:hypothetical protein